MTILQMSDKISKNEENVKKVTKCTARINYKRCSRCGGRKKEEDMVIWFDKKGGLCLDCARNSDGKNIGKNYSFLRK